MTNQGKSILSLSTLALLGLTMTCDVYADSNRDERRTMQQVRSCVSEIANHVDYNGASRASHWVNKLTQKNVAELEIRIETTVYVANSETANRKYKTSCVVAGARNLIKFRINLIEPDSKTRG